MEQPIQLDAGHLGVEREWKLSVEQEDAGADRDRRQDRSAGDHVIEDAEQLAA
jgi:hypothetical protein